MTLITASAALTATSDTLSVTSARLPAEFVDLEQFSKWIIESQDARYEMRLASSMDEMQSLYDMVLARMPDILEYCNTFELDDMPDDAHNLMLLTYSFIQASFSVEAWKQQRVPDSGAAYISCTNEPRI